MKLKILVFCAVLSAALTTTAFANRHPAPDVKSVISEFAESHVNTDAKKLAKILSSEATFKFARGNEVFSQSHVSTMRLMKQNEGIQQNCSTSYEIIASSNALVMAKVNFIYEDFVIENYLTLELDPGQNWKITRINKFFVDAESAKVITRR